MSFEKRAQGAGRYAPSPSGELHLGNLRTALLAWLFARTSGRRFLMRIEDLDRDRDAGSAASQLADLAALGLDWDDDPVFQTDRAGHYDAALRDLVGRGLVYECTCSRQDILQAPTAPHTPPGAYPGTCRNLSDDERIAARERIAPRSPALRLRGLAPAAAERLGISDAGTLSFSDAVLGEVTGVIDDFVLKRGDGTVAYNLAVVVDDAGMGIDQVVRGDDLASSTPRQILLQRVLGVPTPMYAHVPLVLGPAEKRLAKRDGAVTLSRLAAVGVESAEVRSLLALSLGLAREGERVSLATLRERFDPDRIPQLPWVWHGAPGAGAAANA